MVAMVVMKGFSLNTVTKKPLIAPQSMPAASPASTTSGHAAPVRDATAQIMATTAIWEPTEMSIMPEMLTKVTLHEMQPTMAAYRPMFRKFLTLKK